MSEKRISFTKIESHLQKDNSFKYTVTEESVSIPHFLLKNAVIEEEGEYYLIHLPEKNFFYRVKENPLKFLEQKEKIKESQAL